MKSIPICGPAINVRFLRVVIPSTLYLFAFHGDTKGVQSLFTEGSASPWDVNDRGSSALYLAAISGDVGLCRFLIEQGADPLFENKYHTFPVSLAWERILSKEAVLGLVPLPLRHLLDCSTSDINVQDRKGRTGLAWATTRDDIDSSKLLLGHGADVNKSDNRGFSPIHSAKSLPSLKLLLDNNVDIMSKTEVGAAHLHFVSKHGRHEMMAPMVQAHADPNASDANETPLICSTHDHQPKSTETLLRLGANPNLAAKRTGLTTLHFAVTDNQHYVIQQLLSHDADCTLKAEKERNILHLVAFHGDNVIMDILSQTGLTGVDSEVRDSQGKTARECFEGRSEESASGAVKEVFAALLDSISARQGPQGIGAQVPEVFYDAVEEL